MSYVRKDLEDKKPVLVDVPHAENMLCLNESCLNPFVSLKAEFLDVMDKIEINRYHSWVTKKLVNELSDYTRLSEDMIIMGNGADEMLYYLFTAVNDINSYAVSLAPSYFDYQSYSSAVGLELKQVTLDEDFDFNLDKLMAVSKNTDCKLIILCNPNNPTGNLLNKNKIDYIIKNNPDKIILIDETYYEFSGITWSDKLEKCPNLVLIRSFSKGFSSAGLRFGYMLASKSLTSELRKVVTAFNLSIFTQAMVYTILKNRKIFLDHNQQVIKERDRIAFELKKLKNIELYPSSTNFILFRCINSIDLFNYLLKNDIAIRNVGKTALLRDCLRVTAGTEMENNRFLEIVKSFL